MAIVGSVLVIWQHARVGEDMLYRTALGQIEDWANAKTSQGLLITGARQVGKTTAVRQFAKNRYDTFVEINFLETPSAISLISAARNTEDLLLRITALADKELVSGSTLIFFDEIQEFEDILTWAKFLSERTDFDYVFSGSLLGVDLFGIRSWPVGFLDELTMFPLTFEEFCLSQGVQPTILDLAHESIDARKPVVDFIHHKLMDLHTRYLLVGGLPEPLQRFIDTNDMVALRRAHKGVFDLYEYDIARHMQDNEGIRFTQSVYESIPGQLNKENKRFKYSSMGKAGVIHDGDLRFSRLESSFDWLGAAGIALPTTRLDEPRFPLALYEHRASFKLYLNDVGLLMSRLSGTATREVLAGRDDINYGSPYENYVAQELLASGHELFYYANTKRGEVDFVLENKQEGTVSLVEVKSGKAYKRHVALNNLLSVGDYEFSEAIVLCNANVSHEENRVYLPIYAAGWLE